MDYRLEDRAPAGGAELVLLMRGKFTHRDYCGFLDFTDRLATSKAHRVVLDMSGVEFIDSGGVGMLLMAMDVARRNHIPISIQNARGQVATAIERSMGELFQPG